MRILVVRNDKLGDFITALPTIYALKHHNIENKLIVCVAPMNNEFAKSITFIDEVIVDDTNSSLELSKKIRLANIDVSITLFSNTKVAFAQFLAGIKIRIAPATKLAQIFYNKRIIQRRSKVEMSEYEYNLELAKVLFPNINTKISYPLVKIDKEKKEKSISEFKSNHDIKFNKQIIAFHPGFGGSSAANWTIQEYIDLAKEIKNIENIQVVFTFGPGEDDLYDIVKKSKIENIILYKSKGSIMDFATLISNFKFFISTSTGTYHLAAMVGVATITFFGDSLFASVKRWKAVSDEKLQHPYMIPKDILKRKKLFEDVKDDIKRLCL